jgi:hypothetical protein
MSRLLRRYEILLPRSFNDGQPIPDEVLGETLLDLRGQFKAVSCESQFITGSWEFEEKFHADQLVRVFVDVPDSPENRRFFEEFKERLKERFRQIDIWMTSYIVEVI